MSDDWTCTRCRRPLVRQLDWRRLGPAGREEARRAGLRGHVARDLCEACYVSLRRRDELADYQGPSVHREIVLEEWAALADERAGMSQAQACRVFAPRLGMTPAALEKALERAKKVAA